MQGYAAKYDYKHSVLASAAWLKDNIAFTFTLDDVSLTAAHPHPLCGGVLWCPLAATSAASVAILPSVEAAALLVLK